MFVEVFAMQDGFQCTVLNVPFPLPRLFVDTIEVGVCGGL